MAYCNQCGIQLQDGDRFCHSCGTPAPGAGSTSGTGTGRLGSDSRADRKTELRTGPVYGADLENLPPGYVVDDRYEIKEKVGQGGFGAVYRVHDRKLDIDKALKVLPVGEPQQEYAGLPALLPPGLPPGRPASAPFFWGTGVQGAAENDCRH